MRRDARVSAVLEQASHDISHCHRHCNKPAGDVPRLRIDRATASAVETVRVQQW